MPCHACRIKACAHNQDLRILLQELTERSFFERSFTQRLHVRPLAVAPMDLIDRRPKNLGDVPISRLLAG